jgi:hypothetical protein
MNAQSQNVNEDDVIVERPGLNDEDLVVITDPGPARCNGGGPEPDITSRRESR